MVHKKPAVMATRNMAWDSMSDVQLTLLCGRTDLPQWLFEAAHAEVEKRAEVIAEKKAIEFWSLKRGGLSAWEAVSRVKALPQTDAYWMRS